MSSEYLGYSCPVCLELKKEETRHGFSCVGQPLLDYFKQLKKDNPGVQAPDSLHHMVCYACYEEMKKRPRIFVCPVCKAKPCESQQLQVLHIEEEEEEDDSTIEGRLTEQELRLTQQELRSYWQRGFDMQNPIPNVNINRSVVNNLSLEPILLRRVHEVERVLAIADPEYDYRYFHPMSRVPRDY